MKKFFLMILITTFFIWADMDNQKKDLPYDLKTLYTIQDEPIEIPADEDNALFPHETSQMPVGATDSELMPLEDIFETPEEDATEEIIKANRLEAKKQEIPKKAEMGTNRPEGIQKSNKVLEIERIRKELDIKEPTSRTLRIDSIRKELNIGYKVPKNETTFDRRVDEIKESIDTLSVDNAISSIKSTLGMESKKKDTGFFITDSLSDFGDTIGMDIGIPGMPDFLGFGGSKKKESGILDSVMGFGFLGDIKGTGTSIYRGAKYSGQSAEMMSGMMYNSSKMYNTMFGTFDDSPFNMFEEEEESSMFDVFEHGNSVMDMFND